MPMIPLSRLFDHVDVPEGTDAQAFAAALVKAGLEGEEIHPACVTDLFVVGRVLARVGKIVSDDKIVNYCRVDTGEYNDAPGTGKEPSDLPSHGIICDVHNFNVDDLVIVSLLGATLPGDFQIVVRKIYGHVSDGMICSVCELGLGEDRDGIIVLSEYFPDREILVVGTDIVTWLGLGEEALEINVTPDRGYCFLMCGIACEYSHSTDASSCDPSLSGIIATESPTANSDGFLVVFSDDVSIRGRAGVDHFAVRIVRGTNPNAPTPCWMVERLEAAGMRSVSSAVDTTNYVMLDFGQPMHAYDLGALATPIVVRHARVGETSATLGEERRELDPQDLLITDSPEGEGSCTIGIAGTMGGAYPEVGEGTTDVPFEVAHFDSVSAARSLHRHKLYSEAAKRFKRGTDLQLPAVAAQRAVELLLGYGGGTVDANVTNVDQRGKAAVISLSVGEVERLTGVVHAPERIAELLRIVGCVVEGPDNGVFTVTAPSWRSDFMLPTDLVEEVACLDGYDNISVAMPTASAGHGPTVVQKARHLAAVALADGGLVEIESYPFMSDTWDCQGIPADDPRREVVRLCNPMMDDAP